MIDAYIYSVLLRDETEVSDPEARFIQQFPDAHRLGAVYTVGNLKDRTHWALCRVAE